MASADAEGTVAFRWKDAYALGVPEVDAQHRAFLDMASAFMSVATSGRADAASLQAALAELIGYGQTHFESEEAFMERVGFPEDERLKHGNAHNDFMFRVSELAQRLDKADETIAREIVDFMCEWFIKHIMQVDVKYTQFHLKDSVLRKGPIVAAPGSPEPDLPPLPAAKSGRAPAPSALDSPHKLGVPAQIGPYRLGEQLGKGGMGSVFKAVHDTLERPAAIKLLPPEMAANSQLVARFLREARVVAALRHPNIVMVFDAGEIDGRYYIAMELIEGKSLAGYLKFKGKLKEDEALSMLEQSLQGLSAAHAEGLVHRDIKPENLLLDKKRRVHIADFGLVMAARSKASLTDAGILLGTPQYISPEQADGEKTDVRTDLYSLGVTFYEALTGQLPFKAPNAMSVLFKQKYERPVPPKDVRPNISTGTDRLILWLLGKRPEDRPRNAAAVLKMIESIRNGKEIPEPPTPKLPSLPNARKQKEPN